MISRVVRKTADTLLCFSSVVSFFYLVYFSARHLGKTSMQDPICPCSEKIIERPGALTVPEARRDVWILMGLTLLCGALFSVSIIELSRPQGKLPKITALGLLITLIPLLVMLPLQIIELCVMKDKFMWGLDSGVFWLCILVSIAAFSFPLLGLERSLSDHSLRYDFSDDAIEGGSYIPGIEIESAQEVFCNCVKKE